MRGGQRVARRRCTYAPTPTHAPRATSRQALSSPRTLRKICMMPLGASGLSTAEGVLHCARGPGSRSTSTPPPPGDAADADADAPVALSSDETPRCSCCCWCTAAPCGDRMKQARDARVMPWRRACDWRARAADRLFLTLPAASKEGQRRETRGRFRRPGPKRRCPLLTCVVVAPPSMKATSLPPPPPPWATPPEDADADAPAALSSDETPRCSCCWCTAASCGERVKQARDRRVTPWRRACDWSARAADRLFLTLPAAIKRAKERREIGDVARPPRCCVSDAPAPLARRTAAAAPSPARGPPPAWPCACPPPPPPPAWP